MRIKSQIVSAVLLGTALSMSGVAPSDPCESGLEWSSPRALKVEVADMMPEIMIDAHDSVGASVSLSWRAHLHEFDVSYGGTHETALSATDDRGRLCFEAIELGVRGTIDLLRDGRFQLTLVDRMGRTTRTTVNRYGMFEEGKVCVCLGFAPDICIATSCDLNNVCPLGQGICTWVIQ